MSNSAGREAAVVQDPVPSGAGAQAADEIPRGHERVLCIDDEILQAKTMGRLLGYLGYDVTSVTDPAEALETFLRDPGAFDLVILDQMMPHMTGAELAETILKSRPDMPVILCTGFSEGLNEGQFLALGIKAFLWKPFSSREIAQTIRRVLGPSV